MRKIPAALLALTLTASLTAPQAGAAKADSLPELNGHWSQSAFQRWHGYGIVEGDDRGMRPDDAMMVSEFAALLSRTMGYTEQAENRYADLKGDEWYAPYILQLTAAGILEGDGVNCNATELMSRERATVLFARALGIRPSQVPDLSGFVDGDSAAAWSAGYIDAMAKAGIIQGVGNHTLALSADITRASVVTVLDNAVAEYANQKNAQVTGDVDGILLVAADGVTVEEANVTGGVLVTPKAGEATLTVTGSTLEGDLLVGTSGADLTLTGTEVRGELALAGDGNSLTLGKGAQAAQVTVDGDENTIAVGEEAAIGTLTARAAVAVGNQGAIDKAQIQAGGVVLDGAKPGAIEVAEGVDAPTDSEGNPVVDDSDQVPGGEDQTPGGEDSEDEDTDGEGMEEDTEEDAQEPVVLSGVVVSTHELPDGVTSTETGLSFDESTALVQNGGSGTLTQAQVAAMGGGGEYTVYFAVPQALTEGTLQFDKISRAINGGDPTTWSISSQTGAEEGSGWWTKSEDHYFFKWGAVFAQEADGLYQMTDGGIYDYTLSFLKSDGETDSVVATCTFRIDLSGYTISEE